MAAEAHPCPQVPRPIWEGKFEDFDKQDVYDKVKTRSLDQDAGNFVVEFGARKARIALDLEFNDVVSMMKDKQRPADTPIRWINIWRASGQNDILKLIAKEYGFSDRLAMMMQVWDIIRDKVREGRDADKAKEAQTKHDKPPFKPADCVTPSDKSASGTDDLEMGVRAKVAPAPNAAATPGALERLTAEKLGLFRQENLASFQLMQESINYTSIDQEEHFTCIGANWLHNRPGSIEAKKDSEEHGLVPPKHWSWFVLCRSATVITIHEAPCFEEVEDRDDAARVLRQSEELESIRSNMMRVLLQISQCGITEYSHNVLRLTAVRKPLMDAPGGQTVKLNGDLELEGSSNLFYYLFEDYSAAVDVLNRSKPVLENLADGILEPWNRKHKNAVDETGNVIRKLYNLNKELRQLQHLFGSYKVLIERLLADSGALSAPDRDAAGGGTKLLSRKARDRFERLRDQLQSHMLDTIKEYLDEKESLQNAYFNLTNQKDSQATARLTRNATLLAKFSVFFLPITFMTGFFSVQVPELNAEFTQERFWICFAVLLSVSLVFILFFNPLMKIFTDNADRRPGTVAFKVLGERKRARRRVT